MASQRKIIIFNDINICVTNVTASDKSRNRGIIFDNELNIKSQINNICKSGYYQIGNLSVIHNVLDRNSTKTANYAFITSSLGYGSSLLYGLSKTRINKYFRIELFEL